MKQEAEQRHAVFLRGEPLQGERGQGITRHSVKHIPLRETEPVTDAEMLNNQIY